MEDRRAQIMQHVRHDLMLASARLLQLPCTLYHLQIQRVCQIFSLCKFIGKAMKNNDHAENQINQVANLCKAQIDDHFSSRQHFERVNQVYRCARAIGKAAAKGNVYRPGIFPARRAAKQKQQRRNHRHTQQIIEIIANQILQRQHQKRHAHHSGHGDKAPQPGWQGVIKQININRKYKKHRTQKHRRTNGRIHSLRNVKKARIFIRQQNRQ